MTAPQHVSSFNSYLVKVDSWAVLVWCIWMNVEVSHSHFTKVTWMVLVKVDAMVMLATSVTTTSGMLAVFANAAVTMRNMTTKLPSLFLVCAHFRGLFICVGSGRLTFR